MFAYKSWSIWFTYCLTWKKLKVKVKSFSCFRHFATPRTVAHQAPPSMEFSRQEYWSGLPFPSPGDLPDPGIQPRSPALWADALPSEPPGKLPDFLQKNSFKIPSKIPSPINRNNPLISEYYRTLKIKKEYSSCIYACIYLYTHIPFFPNHYSLIFPVLEIIWILILFLQSSL